MRKILALTLLSSLSYSALASEPASSAEAKALLQGMVKNCKTELASVPGKVKLSDAEAVWSALEKIETTKELSPACDAAEEAYEKKYHFETWRAEEEKEAADKAAKDKGTVPQH